MPALVWASLFLATVVIGVFAFREVYSNSGRESSGNSPRAVRLAYRLGSAGIALGASVSAIGSFWEYQTTTFQRFLVIVSVPWVVAPLAFAAGIAVLAVVNLLATALAKRTYRVSQRFRQ